MKYYKILSSPW